MLFWLKQRKKQARRDTASHGCKQFEAQVERWAVASKESCMLVSLSACSLACWSTRFLSCLLPSSFASLLCFALLGLAWFALLGFAWLALLFFGLALLCLAWLCFALPCFALFCSALLACYSDDMTLEQLAKLKRANEDDRWDALTSPGLSLMVQVYHGAWEILK